MANPELYSFEIETGIPPYLYSFEIETSIMAGMLSFEIETSIPPSLLSFEIETGAEYLYPPEPDPPPINYFYRVTNISRNNVQVVSGSCRINLAPNKSIVLSGNEYSKSNVPSLEGTYVTVTSFEAGIDTETACSGDGDGHSQVEAPKVIEDDEGNVYISSIIRKLHNIRNISRSNLTLNIGSEKIFLEPNKEVNITDAQYSRTNIRGLIDNKLIAIKEIDHFRATD